MAVSWWCRKQWVALILASAGALLTYMSVTSTDMPLLSSGLVPQVQGYRETQTDKHDTLLFTGDGPGSNPGSLFPQLDICRH